MMASRMEPANREAGFRHHSSHVRCFFDAFLRCHCLITGGGVNTASDSRHAPGRRCEPSGRRPTEERNRVVMQRGKGHQKIRWRFSTATWRITTVNGFAPRRVQA